jgi:hypothetical protein
VLAGWGTTLFRAMLCTRLGAEPRGCRRSTETRSMSTLRSRRILARDCGIPGTVWADTEPKETEEMWDPPLLSSKV